MTTSKKTVPAKKPAAQAPTTAAKPAAKKVAAKPIAKPTAKPTAQPAVKAVAAKKVAAKKVAVAKPAAKAVPAPAAAAAKLRLFQIYYRPEQRSALDPAFEPYNNQGDNSALLEYNVFRKILQSGQVQGAELWGALSWKFQEKTGLTGTDLRTIIAANPGHDVYYCNPHPEFEALYHNLWLQGEPSHPNFLVLCREFFEVTGIPLDNLKAFVPSSLFASANYFVASPKFWADYTRFVDAAITKAEAGMSKTAKAMIYSSAADRKGTHAGASYLPFIVERLFAVFLANNLKKYSAYKYALPVVEEKLNVHLKLLKQMKDVSINTKSLWMASCWVNYRNLYMSNAYGADWCKKHLKSITPTEFKYTNAATEVQA